MEKEKSRAQAASPCLHGNSHLDVVCVCVCFRMIKWNETIIGCIASASAFTKSLINSYIYQPCQIKA